MSVLFASPDLLLFALLAGILLIYVECNRPGWVVPGCLGTLFVLAAIHGLTRFPLSPAALSAFVLGTLLLVAAIVLPERGKGKCGRTNLTLALAITSLVYGTVNMVQPIGTAQVHLPAALFFSVGFGLSTVWLGRIAVRARRNKLSLHRHPSAAPGVTG